MYSHYNIHFWIASETQICLNIVLFSFHILIYIFFYHCFVAGFFVAVFVVYFVAMLSVELARPPISPLSHVYIIHWLLLHTGNWYLEENMKKSSFVFVVVKIMTFSLVQMRPLGLRYFFFLYLSYSRARLHVAGLFQWTNDSKINRSILFDWNGNLSKTTDGNIFKYVPLTVNMKPFEWVVHRVVCVCRRTATQ